MTRSPRSNIALVLGVLMTILGVVVIVRPLWAGAPLSGSRALDYVFAVFFLLRGVMNLRTARRTAPPPAPEG